MGHPELAWPGGDPCRSPIGRPRPADEDGSARRPGGLRGPIREDSGGVRLGTRPLAGVPDPTVDGESAGGSPTATCREPPDLKRAILQRVGRTPEQHRQRFRSVELGDNGRPFVLAQQLRDACRKWLMAERRRGSHRSGGAGAVHRSAAPSNRRVGPVPPPDVADAGHPAGRGPSGGVPRGG